MAPNLLNLCTETSFDEAFYLELIEATSGRIVPDLISPGEWFGAGANDLFDMEKLPNEVQRKYRQSLNLLDKIEKSLDPTIINEWEK